MFRTALLRSARAAASRAVARPAPIARIAIPTAAPRFAPAAIRSYSAGAGLSKDEVQGRIVDLLKSFDKVRYMS